MMPSTFGAKVLLQLPEAGRADIINRTVNMKNVAPKAASIIETRVMELMRELDAERNSIGSQKIAEVMNEMEKGQVDTLLASLEDISTESVKKVRPKIFLFDDILNMPQRSRVQLLNDVSGDIITMALRGSSMELRECVLASIGARQRRMIESDLSAGDAGINPRDIAIARRSITQEAIRLAASGQIELKEKEAAAAA
jgi:flagellar motor switch protein FliG